MKKQYIAMWALTLLTCLGSCREQNPQDPSVDHDMEGVGESVRDGREKAKKWADDGQNDSITEDSLSQDRLPVKDSL